MSTEADLLNSLRAGGVVPHHVAVIMDGNGRWARERGLPRTEGHRAGAKAVRETVEGAIEAGIRVLTIFAFSQENWQRPPEEIDALMALLEQYVASEADELRNEGVTVKMLGDLEPLSDSSRAAVEFIESTTSGGDKLALNVCISYGSRAEIVRAARQLAQEVTAGTISISEIDEQRFGAKLYTAEWPDPDLLVRTSGENRVSNFLLWQLAYAEFHITSVLWPDFTRVDLFRAVLDFQRRDRRFGRVDR